MSKEKDFAWKEMSKRADQSRDETLESWIVDLKDPDPEDCCNEQEDCENCES